MRKGFLKNPVALPFEALKEQSSMRNPLIQGVLPMLLDCCL